MIGTIGLNEMMVARRESPCGTGTCARMATLYARGRLSLNRPFRHEGILGTIFTGELIREIDLGVGAPYPAVVPTLSGRAWITGTANYMLDPDDPFPEGFTIGDIWGAGSGGGRGRGRAL